MGQGIFFPTVRNDDDDDDVVVVIIVLMFKASVYLICKCSVTETDDDRYVTILKLIVL